MAKQDSKAATATAAAPKRVMVPSPPAQKDPVEALVGSVSDEDDDDEPEAQASGGRPRKEGERQKRSPHKRFFIFIRGEKIQVDEIEAPTLKAAQEIFSQKFGEEPAKVLAGGAERCGYYHSKGTGTSEAQAVSVTVEAEDLQFAGTLYRGEFLGWKVVCNGICAVTKRDKDGNVIKQYADDELMMVTAKETIIPNDKIERPRLKKMEMVHRSKIANLTPVTRGAAAG